MYRVSLLPGLMDVDSVNGASRDEMAALEHGESSQSKYIQRGG